MNNCMNIVGTREEIISGRRVVNLVRLVQQIEDLAKARDEVVREMQYYQRKIFRGRCTGGEWRAVENCQNKFKTMSETLNEMHEALMRANVFGS